MSFSISTAGFEETFKKLSLYHPSQFNFTVSLALNKTAGDVKGGLIKEMYKVFDKPTLYTINSLAVIPSTKSDLTAYVGFKDNAPAKKYLQAEIFGGGRSRKPTEKAIASIAIRGRTYYLTPGPSARLNSYGNVAKSKYDEVIAYFKSSKGISIDTSTKAGQRLANKASSGTLKQFFIITPDDTRNRHLSAGIYERKGQGFLKIFNLVDKPTYQIKFKFFDVGLFWARAQFPIRFNEAMEYALRTAK